MKTQETKSGSEVDQSGSEKIRRVGKSHQDYWAPRLTKRSYEWDGKVAEVPEWQVRIGHLGRREFFNLGTSNRAAAAAKAKDIYLSLLSAGWDDTLAKFKPQSAPILTTTLGDYLDQVKAVSGLKPVTYEIYAKKFRSLAAGVFNINDAKKHDYFNGHAQAWMDRIHAVHLDKLTPERVNKWKVKRLQAASGNPLELKHAQTTVRSILLCSKALFSADVRKHITLPLPNPLPFEGITLPPASKSRFKSEINPALLLQQAKSELAEAEPELFKIVLLAIGAGLRRGEIDRLQWKQIRWGENVIRVEVTAHSWVKSDESEADVSVDPSLLALLKPYLPKPSMKVSQFVIEYTARPRPKSGKLRPKSARNTSYRCDRLFKKLILWLRSKGITKRMAVHYMRGEFGSEINKAGGIYQAKEALRHSHITTTLAHYIDKKESVTLNVGELLAQPVAEQAK